MKKNEKFNFNDHFFDERMIKIIDFCEKKFPDDKSIQKQIKEIKINIKTQTRKVKLEKIERDNN